MRKSTTIDMIVRHFLLLSLRLRIDMRLSLGTRSLCIGFRIQLRLLLGIIFGNVHCLRRRSFEQKSLCRNLIVYRSSNSKKANFS